MSNELTWKDSYRNLQKITESLIKDMAEMERYFKEHAPATYQAYMVVKQEENN